MAEEDGTAGAPPTRWLKRMPRLSFAEAVRRLMAIPTVPPGRTDIYLPDEDDVVAFMAYIEMRFPEIKARITAAFPPEVVARLTDDHVKMAMAYTAEVP